VEDLLPPPLEPLLSVGLLPWTFGLEELLCGPSSISSEDCRVARAASVRLLPWWATAAAALVLAGGADAVPSGPDADAAELLEPTAPSPANIKRLLLPAPEKLPAPGVDPVDPGPGPARCGPTSVAEGALAMRDHTAAAAANDAADVDAAMSKPKKKKARRRLLRRPVEEASGSGLREKR
jgi:hypothetical protein